MSQCLSKPRLELIDALRGFALMGLFIVHMVSFYGLHWFNPEPSATFTIVMWAFSGKAYALFALLFGLSFFIIMDRQASRGVDFRGRFAWRMIVLFLFGYLHSLFYSSDILQILAVCGLLLLIFYGASSKFILLIGLLFLLQVPAIGHFFYLYHNPELANSNPAFWELTNNTNQVFANGSFAEVLRINAFQSHIGKWSYYIESTRIWNIIGLFFVGFWLARKNFFESIERYKNINIIALFIAILVVVVMYFATDYFGRNGFEQALSQWVMMSVLYSYMNTALMVATTLVLILGYQLNIVNKALNLLAPVGRMTLTLYIAQGIIFTPLFFGYGLGWYDTIGHSTSLGLGIILWLAQLVFAHQWFKYYQYGPLEWIWRAATFTRLDIPFKRLLS